MALDPRDRSSCPDFLAEDEDVILLRAMDAIDVIDPSILFHMDTCEYCVADVETTRALGATVYLALKNGSPPDY